MNAKVTLSFDENVIGKAKAFAETRGMSLSKLTEFLYRQVTSNYVTSLEELPVAEWVNLLAEEQAVYLKKPRGRKATKNTFYEKK